MRKQNFSLDGNQLKLIAVFFMIFDHIYSYLFLGVWPAWFSLIDTTIRLHVSRGILTHQVERDT